MPQTSPIATRRKLQNRKLRNRSFQPMRLDPLEARQLLSSINITGFGAVANDGADDSAAINSALRAAAPGDVVNVPAGTFNVNGTITLTSGISLQGVSGSKLDFKISRSAFAIVIAAGSSNIHIDGLAIRSNDGIVSMNSGSGYSNIAITNNDFQWGYDGTYYHRLAVQAIVRSNGLIIEKNYFHDSPSSDRNVDLWNMSNASYSYNTFYYVNDGGHICDSGNNVTVSYNYGRKIHRMGIEIQTWSGNTTNMTVQGNVFFDWDHPWTDSFGLSVMPQLGTNIRILDNYISADFTGGWGPSIDGVTAHFGIGIEAGFTTGVVENNTVIGPWVFGIIASMKNTLVQNNKIFGTQAWGSITVEGGIYGPGSVISVGNLLDKNLADAPAPPPPTNGTITGFPPPGDPGFPDDPTGPLSQPPTGIPTFLSAYVVDTKSITLYWLDSYSDEDGYRVERSLDDKNFTQVYDTKGPNITVYTDHGLPAGTIIYYRVEAYRGDAPAPYSNIVLGKTRGVASTATVSSFSTNNTDPSNDVASFLSAPTPNVNKNSPDFSDILITTV